MLTVTIPNYNNELTLIETLESLDNQKDKNYKILFSDNQSSDNSFLIFKTWAKDKDNCQYISTPKHLTYLEHLEYLVKCTDTNHLLFLAGDDILSQNYTKLANKIISRCDNLNAVFFRAKNFGNNMIDIKRKKYESRNSNIIRYRSLNAPLGNISGNIYRKSFIKKVFSNKEKVKIANNTIDHYFCMEATKSAKYITTNYIGINYRIHNGSWGPKKTRERSINHTAFIFKCINIENSIIENLILLRRGLYSFFAFIKNI